MTATLAAPIPCEHSDACTAAQVRDGRCLAHLHLEDASAYVRRTGIVDLRNAHLSADEFLGHLALLPEGDDGRRTARIVTATNAVVSGDLSIDALRVSGYLDLSGATLEGELSLRSTEVNHLWMRKTQARAGVLASQLAATGDVSFERATIEGPLRLVGASVGGNLLLQEITAMDAVNLSEIRVSGTLRGRRGTFEHSLRAEGANIGGLVDLSMIKASGNVGLSDLTAGETLRIDKGTIVHSLKLNGTDVARDVWLEGLHVWHRSEARGLTVGRHLRCRKARFAKGAVFTRARVGATAWFNNASVEGDLLFQGAQVAQDVTLADTTISGAAVMREMQIDGRTWLDGTAIGGTLDLTGARFSAGQGWGTVKADALIDLTRGRFDESFDAVLDAPVISLTDAIFEGESRVQVASGAQVQVAGTTFRRPSVLGQRHEAPDARLPFLMTAEYADLGNLLVTELDLSRCVLVGAHNLDGLRIGPGARLPRTPPGVFTGFALPFAWTWSPRETLVEENLWRQTTRKTAGWARADGGPEPEIPTPQPAAIATAYRALRKGREDLRDQPGAADFYYGEMEMRRRAAGAFSAEGLVLWLYWLLSGYGLRASRAVIAMLCVITLFTGLFQLYGFADVGQPFDARAANRAEPPPRQPPSSVKEAANALDSVDAWVYTAGTALSVVGAPQVELTTEGRALRVVLRLLGPILIGLALFAIRGRVKR